MVIPNPFRPDGSYTTADQMAELERVLGSRRAYYDRLVAAGTMRPVNRDANIGALESLLEDLKARQAAAQN